MASNKSKGNNKGPAQTATAQATVAGAWAAEHARIMQAAKEKPGSRGNALQKAGEFAAGDSPAAKLLREACGEAGGQALVEQPRNVLVKLPALARAIASGQPWCSPDAIAQKRAGDASVAVTIDAMRAGCQRQKEIIAHVSRRYAGGANAQVPAALGALDFMGVIVRADGPARNASYSIKRPAVADKLVPQVSAS